MRPAPAVGRLALLSLALGSAGISFGVVGCTSTAPPPPESRVPELERAYVLDPLSGYPSALDEPTRQRIREVHRQLGAGSELSEVSRQADALLLELPDLAPAVVLSAQMRFLEDREREAVDRLEPIVAATPDYVAASLLRARALERLGEIPEAFEAYRALATSQRVAAEKAEALGPRAEQAVRRRFDQALARGRIEDAEGLLSVLRSWRPDATATLLHERRWLEAKGDEAGELDLLRRLFAGGPAVVGSGEVGSGKVLPPARDREDPSAGEDVEPGWDEPTSELRRRWGRLEVTVGDIHSGVEIFETLSAAHQAADMPVDSSLADDLARAKFLYRLELLPPEAKAVARSPELDRAQLATLLYWLFPSVRFSEIDAPPIAQDILEEPARQEILRVLDLGLMGVDATRHRFEPRAPATRRGALAALLHLLTQSDPAVSCVAGEPVLPAGNRSRRWVCFKAAECGLIAEELDCLPAASLSGAEALEFVRRAQELAGSP